MKTRYLNIILASILVLVAYTSCCDKGAYELAGINVFYPELTETAILKSARFIQGDSIEFLDTLTIGELKQTNNYSQYINFEFFRDDQIIFVVNTGYADTLTDIYFERSYCKREIKNFEYRFNGKKTDKLIITITGED